MDVWLSDANVVNEVKVELEEIVEYLKTLGKSHVWVGNSPLDYSEFFKAAKKRALAIMFINGIDVMEGDQRS